MQSRECSNQLYQLTLAINHTLVPAITPECGECSAAPADLESIRRSLSALAMQEDAPANVRVAARLKEQWLEVIDAMLQDQIAEPSDDLVRLAIQLDEVESRGQADVHRLLALRVLIRSGLMENAAQLFDMVWGQADSQGRVGIVSRMASFLTDSSFLAHVDERHSEALSQAAMGVSHLGLRQRVEESLYLRFGPRD